MTKKMKIKLPTVTLIGIDCVDIERLITAAKICTEHFEFGAVKLLSSKESSNWDITKIPDIPSIEDYSKFMITELDQYVDTPHAIIFQYDGFILNPNAWTDEFLKYDYIGAPWNMQQWLIDKFDLPQEALGKTIVGNGGFCLRSKKFISLCAELAREGKFARYNPEDLAVCVIYRRLFDEKEIQFAPPELARQFSFEGEGLDKEGWDGQFGFHGFRWTNISKWEKDHPEYNFDRFKLSCYCADERA
jgi:hypothetical protein